MKRLFNLFKKENYTKSGAEYIAGMQAKIDTYSRVLDDLTLVLMIKDSLTIEHSDDHRVKNIHNIILDMQKELLKTEDGRKFMEKHTIKKFK